MSSPSDPSSSNPLGKHLLAAARRDHESVSTDDSTMFSLDRLMADAAPASDAGFGESHEDSGLIDLQALASGAALTADRGQPVPWLGGGEFPLGAPLPTPVVPDAVVQPAQVAPRAAGRVITLLLAVMALLLAAAVVFLLVRGSGSQADIAAAAPPGSTTALPTAQIRPEPPSEPVAKVELSTEADSAGSAAATASPGSTTTSAGQRPRPRPSQISQQRPAPAPATTGAKQPKDKGCDCKPNDLDCHMHCSVKR